MSNPKFTVNRIRTIIQKLLSSLVAHEARKIILIPPAEPHAKLGFAIRLIAADNTPR